MSTINWMKISSKIKKESIFFEEITVPKQFKELFDKNYFAMNSNLLLDLRYLLWPLLAIKSVLNIKFLTIKVLILFRFYYGIKIIFLILRSRDYNYSYKKQPPKVLYKKGVLRNFTKFTGKHLFQSLFFNKVAGMRPATLLKKRIWHRYFPVNYAKFL